MEAIKLNTNSEINIYKSKKYAKKIHGNSSGYITVASKNPNYSQWHYKKDELLDKTEEIVNGINDYISQNTFYKPQRRIENIKELRAVYIDIDCYNSKYTKDAVQYFLEHDLYGYKIPRPNYLIDSGRGLYYIVLIKPVPSMALPLWYAVQRYLFNTLKEFGADANALDPTRVLRIVGTMNSKSGTSVKVLDEYDYEYSLREIQSEYLPEINPNKKKSKGRPKKMINLFTEYSLYYARLMDISKICELRNYDVEGHREVILFLYRYYSACFTEDAEEALRRALELNSMFTKPLPNNEVIRDTKSATKAYENKLYKYTNTKLIQILDITLDEQQYLRTIISGKEKYRRSAEEQKEKKKAKRRKENGLTKREQNRIDNINLVKELYDKGHKQVQIVKELGLSKGRVSQIIKELKYKKFNETSS
ncbi:DNA-binding response regulator [Paraclostridium bifermentans]|uniref:DNA-binding response regulator n=1 Tax=Paraclostridium bifermentans TaxID=1490 RepID=UPI0029082AD9|nr:DNA-binding response regulator [Paraclostridium bifermentans]MDU3338204.1 DNA-binding response regulator [Paraclostridium bifermentans]